MLHKLRNQTKRSSITISNKLPNQRSSQYLRNFLNFLRQTAPSASMRAAMGVLGWSLTKKQLKQSCVAYKNTCLLSGRSRGTSRRFSIARTKIKQLSSQGRLFGARKSSW